MSAYVVGKEHIDALVNAGRQYAGLADQRPEWLNACGSMLWTENYRSVNYRYTEDEATPEYQATLIGFELAPVPVLKAIDCYEYQACEHPEWETSAAHDYVEALRQAIFGQHPELGKEVSSRYNPDWTTYAYQQIPACDGASRTGLVTDLLSVTVLAETLREVRDLAEVTR